MRKQKRRGSHAVEFALIFPIFVTFVFGGIDYFWYLLQKYQFTDAVTTGCRTGAIAGSYPYIDAMDVAADTIAVNIGNMGVCDGVNLCSVSVDASEGPADNVWMLECGAELMYQPIVGMVPMPMLLSAESIHPVEMPIEETGEL
tara:strand:+ start:457 stop:888 length:432 start_codon:yes stop_codon:yes gene_type:complete